ncbi:cytochrome c554 and C-prime [Leptospira interrogans serovar Valbuzzi str. Duyster]|uniref:multiheme c-type cytochrome n=1 Tax=Leptospira interrogans TaxID=173 RepID=UPI0002BE4FC7|nr:multiheme c-type cytochrome [Leptospira interrogans]EMJ59331.1 cytochrome c554 and C-prime [Leptospira interrogans serovar Valbuzzi str. Duyster]ENO71166.1 cytochrome c554 and C-prime [Leptospira interrogans serovar Valbuzzi str. Valbuzzi]
MKRFLLLFLLFINCREDSISTQFRLSNGIKPIYFDLYNDLINISEKDKVLNGSKTCQSCHKNIFENWQKSMHSQSFTNPFYQESHAKEPMAWCLNCHAPLLAKLEDEQDPEKRILKEEGVSCIVCHVRKGKILTPEKPNHSLLTHEYLETPVMQTSEFCANCHQFNFPANDSLSMWKTKEFKYSNLPMQNTYNEWKSSGWSDKKNCQSCHLFPKTKRSHSFPGGHNLEYLASAFDIQLTRIGIKQFVLIVSLKKTGHSFPTGDLFRALRIQVLNNENQLIKEWVLKKEYTSSLDKSPEGSPKSLINDFIFQPQKDRKVNSIRQFHFTVSKKTISFQYKLYIDYLNGFTHTFGSLPIEKSIFLFKSGKLEILLYDNSQG